MHALFPTHMDLTLIYVRQQLVLYACDSTCRNADLSLLIDGIAFAISLERGLYCPQFIYEYERLCMKLMNPHRYGQFYFIAMPNYNR